MSDDVTMDSMPIFETIEDLHTRSISTPTTFSDAVEMDISDEDVASSVQPTKRGRGRPKGSKNRTSGSLPIGPDLKTEVSGRVAKDVSLRTQQVLKGASSIPAIWRPPYQMHDIEAQNIADPLASYVTRKAELSPVVEALLNDFDLVAAVVATVAYGVRVYKENGEFIQLEREQNRRPQQSRQAPMGGSSGTVNQNQPTERPNPPTENRNGDRQPVTQYDPVSPAISTPFTGEL